MPPITRAPVTETWGDGLRSLNQEEEKQNELTSHSFDVPYSILFDSNKQLTDEGQTICRMLSLQLLDLPFRAAIQFSDQEIAGDMADMLVYLFHTEMTRPGQVAMTLVPKEQLNSKNIRILIERFTPNSNKSESR